MPNQNGSYPNLELKYVWTKFMAWTTYKKAKTKLILW